MLSVVIVTLPVDLLTVTLSFCVPVSVIVGDSMEDRATLTQERLTLHASLQLIGVEEYVGC